MILVLEAIEPRALELLREVDDVRHVADPIPREADLAAALEGAQAVVVRNRTRLTRSLLDGAPHLKVVGRLGSGLDNLDLRAIRDHGLVLVTGEGANAVAVAEWVLGYLFYLAKPFALADQAVRSGNWDRSLGGRELYGKTLGIVGFGNIGRSLARRASALGLRILTAHPHLRRDEPSRREAEIEALPLPDLLQLSDIVSVHVPLVAATRRLFSGDAFSLMKRGALFVQTSRGGVVDEAALARALASGHLGGALVDVFADEPPDPRNPLFAAPNCILTPHVAGLAEEARLRVDLGVAQGVVTALRQGGFLERAL